MYDTHFVLTIFRVIAEQILVGRGMMLLVNRKVTKVKRISRTTTATAVPFTSIKTESTIPVDRVVTSSLPHLINSRLNTVSALMVS